MLATLLAGEPPTTGWTVSWAWGFGWGFFIVLGLFALFFFFAVAFRSYWRRPGPPPPTP